MADPLFSSIPSLDPARGKTAIFFHAKDDHAEIRAKVFELIRTFDFKFTAIIRDMRIVRSKVEDLSKHSMNYRYTSNELYDFSVLLLFWQRIHHAMHVEIILSKRGASDRTESLRREFENMNAASRVKQPLGSIRVTIENSRHSACLQLVDYCLWALQRAYERGDVRFLHAIWDKVRFIYDSDGENRSYSSELSRNSNPPTEEELKARWI